MSIGEAFDTYFKAIEPDPVQVARAHERQRDLRTEISKYMAGTSRHSVIGSYARGTHVRPMNDIDILLELDPGMYPNRRAAGPRSLLDQLLSAIQRTYPTQGASIRKQRRSVSIRFKELDVGFDVIPAFARDPSETGQRTQGYDIPDLDTNDWILTFPDAAKAKCDEANARAGGKLNRLIKAAKHWNRSHESPHSRKPLRSFHLEVLCYRVFSAPPAKMWTGLREVFHYLATHSSAPCPPPAGQRPDLASYLNNDDDDSRNRRNRAQRRLREAVRLADAALAAERAGNEPGARAAWRELLGPSFPA